MSTITEIRAATDVSTDAESDLPEGWCFVPLRELCSSFEYGTSAKSQTSGKTPVLRMGNIQRGEIDWSHLLFTSDPGEIERYALRPNTVLFNRTNSPELVGKTAIYRGERPAIFAGYLIRINHLPQLDPEYLNFCLNTNHAREFCSRLKTDGVSQSNINARKLGTFEVLFCPLAEQKRIVAKIEELFKQVKASRDRLAKVPKILKRFRQSVLAAACSGRLTEGWREQYQNVESSHDFLNRLFGRRAIATVPAEEDPIDPFDIPEPWSWSRCEYLCDPERDLTYGVIKLGSPVEGGIPTLRSSDVRWLSLEDDHIKRISPKIASVYSRTFLRGHEVLVTVRGSLGGVAVVQPSMAGFNISREVAMLPLHSAVNSRFVSFAIASMWSQNWLSEVTKGVAYTGINIRDLKRLPLPFPPLGEQHEIVRRVEALFKLADMIEKRVEAATKRADKLTQAVLAKAFRGQLAPTEAELARREGRDYEPASVMLERIRVEREKSAPTKGDGKRPLRSKPRGECTRRSPMPSGKL